MSQIQINAHERTNWSLEDKNGKVALEMTYNRLGEPDGFNIGVSWLNKDMSSTWLSLEEAKSLRQWLNKSLDGVA